MYKQATIKLYFADAMENTGNCEVGSNACQGTSELFNQAANDISGEHGGWEKNNVIVQEEIPFWTSISFKAVKLLLIFLFV